MIQHLVSWRFAASSALCIACIAAAPSALANSTVVFAPDAMQGAITRTGTTVSHGFVYAPSSVWASAPMSFAGAPYALTVEGGMDPLDESSGAWGDITTGFDVDRPRIAGDTPSFSGFAWMAGKMAGKMASEMASEVASALPDADGDGIADDMDNRPDRRNASHEDSGGNGLGDACEERCVRIQRDLLGDVADSYIADNRATKNYGDYGILITGKVNDGRRQLLLNFDVGAIPASARISSTFLVLTQTTSTGPGSLDTYEVLAPWSELGVTYENFDNAIDPAMIASFVNVTALTGATSGHISFAASALTDLVQRWVSGATPNYGILMDQPGAVSTTFRSSEHGVLSERPSLYVCYTLPEG